MGLLKVILYLYYVMVVKVYYFFKMYLINIEKEMFYKILFFFWSVGYLYWEISIGGIWVIMINVFYLILMVDVVLIFCEIIVREKLI